MTVFSRGIDKYSNFNVNFALIFYKLSAKQVY